MKVESNQAPHKKYAIENHINEKVDVIFFDNILEEDDKVKYDMYRITVLYRDTLEKDINDNYEKWLEYAKKKEYDVLAEEIRAKRNELLKESDQYMCLDRMNIDVSQNEEISLATVMKIAVTFFKSIFKILKGDYAKYRQDLRDITTQPGFPYDVKFPDIPSVKKEE